MELKDGDHEVCIVSSLENDCHHELFWSVGICRACHRSLSRGAIIPGWSKNMTIAPSNKEILRQFLVSMPLPLSKWLYALARKSVFPDERQPYFEMAFQKVRNMQLLGDYLEFGVYRGTSFVLAASSAARYGLNTMRYFAFDSFQGLPEAEGKVFAHGEFECSEQNFTRIITKAGVPIDKVVKVKGWYNESLTKDIKEKYKLERAAVVHVDCDLYSSTKDVLAFIEDIIQVGTIIIFDDWSVFRNEQRPKEFGEPKAFNEWPLRGTFEDFYEFGSTKAFIMTSRKMS
jgi:O-methyltransferase